MVNYATQSLLFGPTAAAEDTPPTALCADEYNISSSAVTTQSQAPHHSTLLSSPSTLISSRPLPSNDCLKQTRCQALLQAEQKEYALVQAQNEVLLTVGVFAEKEKAFYENVAGFFLAATSLTTHYTLSYPFTSLRNRKQAFHQGRSTATHSEPLQLLRVLHRRRAGNAITDLYRGFTANVAFQIACGSVYSSTRWIKDKLVEMVRHFGVSTTEVLTPRKNRKSANRKKSLTFTEFAVDKSVSFFLYVALLPFYCHSSLSRLSMRHSLFPSVQSYKSYFQSFTSRTHNLDHTHTHPVALLSFRDKTLLASLYFAHDLVLDFSMTFVRSMLDRYIPTDTHSTASNKSSRDLPLSITSSQSNSLPTNSSSTTSSVPSQPPASTSNSSQQQSQSYSSQPLSQPRSSHSKSHKLPPHKPRKQKNKKRPLLQTVYPILVKDLLSNFVTMLITYPFETVLLRSVVECSGGSDSMLLSDNRVVLSGTSKVLNKSMFKGVYNGFQLVWYEMIVSWMVLEGSFAVWKKLGRWVDGQFTKYK